MKITLLKGKLLTFIVSLIGSMFSCFALAGDIKGKMIESKAWVHMDNTINGVALDPPSINGINIKTQGEKGPSDGERGPGVGISYFEVYAVASSNVGAWEVVGPNQTTTSYNHGGSLLRVAVLQIGLGNPNNAYLNGISKSRYATDNLCGTDLHLCSAGEIITGFLFYYAFDGQQNGSFSNASNSVANPFGYWSDSIYIQ